MRTEILTPHVILAARRAPNGVAFDYTDSDGREAQVRDRAVGIATRFRAAGAGELSLFPSQCGEWLKAYLAAMPWQTGRHATGRSPLAVFVRVAEPKPEESLNVLAAMVAETLPKA